MRLIDEALQFQPAAELLQARQKIYQSYAKDLKEFCIRYPLILLNHAGERYPWTSDMLELYVNKIFCGRIQSNESVVWDYTMIKRFQKVLHARSSNLGTGFPGNGNICISLNEMQQLDYRIAQKYREKKEIHPDYKDDHLDRDAPFFINKAFDGFRSSFYRPMNIDTTNFVWSEDAMSSSQHKDDFWRCFTGQLIPWTKTALEKVKQRSSYEFRILCSGSYFTTAQLIEFKDILDWSGIALNPHLHWSSALYDQFKDQLVVAKYNFSKNTAFPWTLGFIIKNIDALSFAGLSGNTSLPFTVEFILKFQTKWSYLSKDGYSLSSNMAIPWSETLMDNLKDRLNWEEIAKNTGVPWTIQLIEKYLPVIRDREMFIVHLSYNKTVWKRVLQPFLNKNLLMEIQTSIPDEYDHFSGE